jgi:hypothetical protein
MKAKAKALILVVMFALPGCCIPFDAYGAASSISYRALNNNPEPGAPLPDLIVVSATFYFSKVVVIVKNVGKGPSGNVNLALQLLSGTSPSSKVANQFNRLVPPLHSGERATLEIAIGKLTFYKHARKVIIDDKNVVIESNENNNDLFSNSDPVAEQGDFPKPAGSLLSNLTFSQVKFIVGDTEHFCVKNIGGAQSGSFIVKTTIFVGQTKESGIDFSSSYPEKSLMSGEIRCQDSFFGGGGPKSVLEGRGRLVEIILDKGAMDADSTNKTYFSPGIEGLWQKKN